MAYVTSPDDAAHLQSLMTNETASVAPAQNTANASAPYVTSTNDIAHLQGLMASQNTAQPTQTASQDQSTPLYQTIPGDITSGLANAGQAIARFGTNAINGGLQLTGSNYRIPIPTQYNFGNLLGSGTTTGDKLIQGAAGYAPLGALGEALPVVDALGSIGGAAASKVAQYLSQSPRLSGLLDQFLPGAISGGTQSQNPLTGAAEGGALNLGAGAGTQLAGRLLGNVLGTQNASNAMGNNILNYLTSAARKGSANPPEVAAANIAENYSGITTPGVGPDIGTVANNPALKGAYSALQYMPGTGVSTNINLMKNDLLDNQINQVKDNLNQQVQDPVSKNMIDQLGIVGNQQSQLASSINQAPSIVNSLIPQGIDKSNLNSVNSDALRSLYKSNKATSTANYNQLIPYQDVRLDQFGGNEQYPNYATAANQLLAQKQNLQNLFGSSSDMGSALNSEMEKASSFLNNNQQFGSTLGEVTDRTKQLGNLAYQLFNGGNRNEARLIMGMKNGLETDVNNITDNNGMPEVSQLWNNATQYYRNNVTNFWDNPTIQKTVDSSDYVSPGTKLATALHLPDPRINNILNQLPQDNKNISLAQLLTKGQGTSSGNFNLSPQQLGSNYAGLNQNIKRAVSSYAPDADSYFENLPTMLNNNDRLLSARDAISQQLQKSTGDNQKQVGELSDQLKNLQNQKYGADKAGSTGSDFLKRGIQAGALGGAAISGLLHHGTVGLTLPLLGGARTLAKTLHNPDLINAYVNRQQLPVYQSAASNLYKGVPYAVQPQVFNNQGASQNGS